MRPAVDDVHERHRQHPRRRPAEIAVHRQPEAGRRRPRHRERAPEHRVGAQPRLVRRAVQLQQHRVDRVLVGGVGVDQLGGDDLVDVAHRGLRALAEVALGVAVAQLERLVRASRRAGRHRRPRPGAIVQGHFHFEGRVAARIEDFPRVDAVDGEPHGASPSQIQSRRTGAARPAEERRGAPNFGMSAR